MTAAPQSPLRLVESLRKVDRVAVLTGAGTSAESGIPTFRQAQTGLWSQFSPEELATPMAFAENPKRVWEWYAWRRELVTKARPNPGHLALAQLARRFPQFTLITQNVDGLHQQAGSQEVLELHGNILRTKCSREGRVVEKWTDTPAVPPPCPHCGAHLRPDVVWFHEALPQETLDRAMAAAASCQVFFSIGTSTVVSPAADLPFIAIRNGAVIVEINPEPTPLTESADYVLAGPSGMVLPELLTCLA